MANVTKIKKLDLKFERTKRKEYYNGIYCIKKNKNFIYYYYMYVIIQL